MKNDIHIVTAVLPVLVARRRAHLERSLSTSHLAILQVVKSTFFCSLPFFLKQKPLQPQALLRASTYNLNLRS